MADINLPVQGANTGTWGTDLNNWLKENVFTPTGWLKDPVYVSQYITHKDDADTYLDFTTDALSAVVGGVELLRFTEDGTQDKVWVNPAAADVDFIVGNNFFKLDAGDGRAFINCAASLWTGLSVTLEIHEGTDAAGCFLGLFGSRTTTNQATRIRGGGCRTSLTSPSASQLDDILFEMCATGYGDTAWLTTPVAIRMHAAEHFTDAVSGTYISIHTTAIGSLGASITERMRIDETGINVTGLVRCDTFRLDQAASSGSLTCDKYVTMNFNGTSYKVPCVLA
jgi:hypothetical protein